VSGSLRGDSLGAFVKRRLSQFGEVEKPEGALPVEIEDAQIVGSIPLSRCGRADNGSSRRRGD
jgi:hypothetical protein